VDYWAEVFDWSRLQRLKTSYVDFALKIMPKLTALKEIDLLENHSEDEIVRFYKQCPTALEAIGAESLLKVTLDGVLRHGSALRKLRLHNIEDWKGKWVNGAIDAASLRTICESCPLSKRFSWTSVETVMGPGSL